MEGGITYLARSSGLPKGWDEQYWWQLRQVILGHLKRHNPKCLPVCGFRKYQKSSKTKIERLNYCLQVRTLAWISTRSHIIARNTFLGYCSPFSTSRTKTGGGFQIGSQDSITVDEWSSLNAGLKLLFLDVDITANFDCIHGMPPSLRVLRPLMQTN